MKKDPSSKHQAPEKLQTSNAFGRGGGARRVECGDVSPLSVRRLVAEQVGAGRWCGLPSRQVATGESCDKSQHSKAGGFVRRLGAWCFSGAWILALGVSSALAADTTAEIKNLTINGGLDDDKARLVIEAKLKGIGAETKLIFATAVQQHIHASFEKLTHSFRVDVDVIQGDPKEIALVLSGDGDVRQVTGDGLQDWSVRQQGGGSRFLVLRPRRGELVVTNLAVKVIAETELSDLPKTVVPLAIGSSQPALAHGYVRVDADSTLSVRSVNPTNVMALEEKFLPQAMRIASTNADAEPLMFRFQGASYALPLRIATADPEARRVSLVNFQLTGVAAEDSAAFILTATARVRNPKGDVLELLSGAVALTDYEKASNWRMKFENGRFIAVFDEPGDYAIRLKFNAALRLADTWSSLDFKVGPSALQPFTLQGLPADTQFRFAGGAKPERKGGDFVSFLPADGAVQLSWKTARPESEGKLFYSAEMVSQISVSPGLMRQSAILDGRVMQGELTRMTLLLTGAGEVTRVLGEQVLSWNVEPVANSKDRRLVVQFNQPQKDQFLIQVQMQTPLTAFPQAFDAMRLSPEGATRFAGYSRVVNEGAVRLEVVNATGLSQVAPEQFPESDVTRALLRADAKQRFVYRFSGASYTLRIQADNVLPEISVSAVTAYHLAETELAIDAEIELDVREAPIREVQFSVPKGYVIARLLAAGMSDYFLKEVDGENEAQLRIVYGQPVIGRQIVALRLERNKPLGGATWALPRVDVPKAKSVRGHVAVSADAGFRVTPSATQGLSEIATAFFPRKVAGIQVALRVSDAAWQATVRVERLPQSISVDAFHLFSIGERIAYGSSVMNYQISGAPVSTFRVDLSNEYYNVEFLGKDVRNWQKTDGAYEIHLHTPVAGAYTLLATYERPFKGQGETLAFSGARPLDAQSEQGHTIVVSAYQFQTNATVSPGLLPLEPAEVPAEYRLFFDAPILAAYRYTSRPFTLQLVLSPLAQGDTLNQVADRAAISTRISKQGQVVTDARYFVKNRGQPHFKLTLPAGMELWSATVNGATAVPTMDGKAHLIALPQRADPNAVSTVDLKLASRATDSGRVSVAAPIVGAPVLLSEWKVMPDAGQRLLYRKGSLAPAQGIFDDSGFAQLIRLLNKGEVLAQLMVALGLFVAGVVVWRWASRPGIYKFSAQHVTGVVLGVVAMVFCVVALVKTAGECERMPAQAQALTFVAPIQPAGNALSLEVANIPDKPSFWLGAVEAWPALLALVVLIYSRVTRDRPVKSAGIALTWTLLFWAALRWPNGVPSFFAVLLAFVVLQLAVPSLRRVWNAPVRPRQTPPPDAAAPAVALLIGAMLLLFTGTADAAVSKAAQRNYAPIAESVTQQVRVDDKFAFATTKVHWTALKGQSLPVLFGPAVLTRISFPTNALKLVDLTLGNTRRYELVALEHGVFDVEFEYQLQPVKKDGESGFALPTQRGLVNELTLTLQNLDVDVVSPSAVSVESKPLAGSSNTVARLVLSPVNDAWIGWRPRSRDTKREKAVFYADVAQLYVPSAGVIEGQHWAQIRPAHGELSELLFLVPGGATVTDVIDPAATGKPGVSLVSLWRFDPDTRQLRVTLKPAQAKPFALLIRSQVAVGTLPFEQKVGLISVLGAAGQIGSLGVATGPDVQLDNVTAETFTAINLEDFPAGLVQRFAAQFAGLTLRRAWRYAETAATATVSASAVEPDVRVESQQTLSLGEDRTVLAATLTVDITRAGIFRLSFVLPGGLDVESISGAALSHWTELKADGQRIITLHLQGKKEGQQQFSISLSGPGVKAAPNWSVPRLLLREASKQRGQLVIVPEQGLRLQVATRDGLAQLDPQKAGIRQKGVLAFRLLQDLWSLALDMEQVDAWVQVESLQHVVVGEAQTKVTANFQYKIENTGLKSLRVFLPTNAESVQFRGEQVADFVKRAGAVTNGLQEWEVKLHRRVIGVYALQATFQELTGEQSRELVLRGVEAAGVNLQRGFVTVESAGRLQIGTGTLPGALQPSEWQTVPRALRQDLQAAAANYTFRLVEPSFRLGIKVQRHEVAKLLPARVNHITLKSVVSDDGMMLTQVRLDMVPGDKRLLNLMLPANARFWFAFVNQNGVAPWLEKDRILIPLEQQSKPEQAIAVEIFYSSDVGKARSRELDLALLGPKFDLPLEDITWQVFLNEKWKLKEWSGTLQLVEAREVAGASINLGSYLQQEAALRSEKTKVAEQQLQLGNQLLVQGAPQQARQAFQNAYGLSQHDMAFNEDARVQLHNLKMQQALVGLNVRQSGAAGDVTVQSKVRELRNRSNAAYTQDEAKQLFERNAADDNAALVKLAERMIQQQDAAVAAPAAIRAAIPEQGRVLTFKRAVQVDTWADLRIGLATKVAPGAPVGSRLGVLGGLFVLVALGLWARPKRA